MVFFRFCCLFLFFTPTVIVKYMKKNPRYNETSL